MSALDHGTSFEGSGLKIATGGVVNIQGGVGFDAQSAVVITLNAPSPLFFVNGVPVSAFGEVYAVEKSSATPPFFYLDGLQFDAAGRLVIVAAASAANPIISSGGSVSGDASGAIVVSGGVVAATTWNPADKSPTITLSNGNMTCVDTDVTQNSVRATNSHSTGKYYFEIHVPSTYETWHDVNYWLGLYDAACDLTAAQPVYGVVGGKHAIMRLTGHNGNESGPLTQVSLGLVTGVNTIGFACDFSTRNMHVYINGVFKATVPWGTGGSPDMFPTASLEGSGKACTLACGTGSFNQAIPAGYSQWNSSGGGGVTTEQPVGGNIAGFVYYEPPRLTVNMFRQGYTPIETYAGGSAVALDASGNPTANFMTTPHWLDNPGGVVQDCPFQCNGYVAAADVTFLEPGVSVADWNYDHTTNTTIFKVRFASTWTFGNLHIKFNNTIKLGRDSGGAALGPTNTGLTNIQMAHPGYTIADIASKVWTDEAVAYFTPNTALRMMDLQGINHANYTWATANRYTNTKVSNPTWEDMCHLVNKCDCDLWMQIPHSFTSDADCQAAFDLVESIVETGRKIIFGYSNEHTFSVSFNQFNDILIWTCLECKAFVGGVANATNNRSFTANRTSGVITISTVEDHLYSNGQKVYISGLDGAAEGSEFTITTTGVKSFTFPKSGSNGAITANSSTWIIGNLNTTLRYGPTTAEDGCLNLYALKNRYALRRLKELSDLCRARPTIGDAKMMTRWFPVWEDQMVNNTGDEEYDQANLNYIKNKWTARSVNQYVGGLAGAPYFFCHPYQETAGVSVAQVVGRLALVLNQEGNMPAKVAYRFEGRVLTAKQHGLALGSLWYEGGPDTKSFSLSGSDLVVRNAAQFDSGIKQPCKDYLNAHFQVGGGTACWYTIGFCDPTSSNRDTVWGVTDSIANLATPKLQAMAEVRAATLVVTRNRLDLGPVDGQLYADIYTAAGYGNLTTSKRKYALNWYSDPADISIRVKYTCNWVEQPVHIRFNGALVPGSPYQFVSQGDGVPHDTLRASPGPASLATFIVHVDRGANVISFERQASQGDSTQIFSIEKV